MDEIFCVIGCNISSTFPYLCNKVKENGMKWLQKCVFSSSPTAWTAQQEKKGEDFLLSLLRNRCERVHFANFSASRHCYNLLTGIKANNEKN